jgi:HK97 gp10 family phage protein
MNVKISLSGVKEIDDVLKGLPKQLQHRVLVAAHKYAAQPFVQTAKSIAPKRTGKMAESIGVVGLNQKNASVIGEVEAGPMPKKGRAYVARFIERGTVKRQTLGRGKYRRGANRGKVPANRFLESAFMQTKQVIESRIAEGIGKRLFSFMKRTIKKGKQ